MPSIVYCPLQAAYPRLYAKVLTQLFELEADEPYELSFGVSKGAENAELDRVGKLERARRLAVDGGYDSLLVVDASVQVPPDVLPRLLAIEGPAVCAVTVHPEWPHAWQTDIDSGCILYRREALWTMRQNGVVQSWMDGPVICASDVYCTRMTMEDGGKMITPDPEAMDRVQIRYVDQQRAPSLVPYTRTLLAPEAG